LDKAPDAFRTISEVAGELDVPQHVLRFWESRFQQIRPMKRGGGRRYYRPDDVDLLRGIRHLLYGEGYTIRGVQRILRDQGVAFVQGVWQAGAEQPVSDPRDEDEAADEVVAEAALPERARRDAKPDGHEGERRELRLGPDTARPPMSQPAPVPAAAQMSAAQLRTLREALDNLAECRRLIDAALAPSP
jgi:DNA-binding transcriptional MerR regulator